MVNANGIIYVANTFGTLIAIYPNRTTLGKENFHEDGDAAPHLLESVVDFGFRCFSGLFWPLFNPKLRGNIDKSILPLRFGLKSGLKRTRKTTETEIKDRLLD